MTPSGRFGIRRVIAVCSVLYLCASVLPSAAQQPQTASHPRVRLTTASAVTIGTLTSADDSQVVVSRDDGSAVGVPRLSIVRLEQSDGRRSRKRSVLLGLLIGGGGGAGIGYAIGRRCHSTAFLGCFLEPGASTLAGLLLGGGGGVLLGTFTPRGERWRPLSVASLATK